MKSIKFSLLISLALLLNGSWAATNQQEITQSTQSCNDLVISTKNGQVAGVTYVKNGAFNYQYRVMNGWLGIPFAQKPLSNLRFKPPVDVANWQGVLNATKLPNACFQAPINGSTVSEDCLYLNVFTPHPMPKNAAVMVWIHGGGFRYDSSAPYDPKTIVTETQVVFVSIQYRLNIFGYMYLNNTDAPGNMGMLDQVMALKWIKNNIQSFGGDPSRITLFGQSAGAHSVSLHLLSPLSRDYYTNAIMESGSCLTNDVSSNKPATFAKYLSILRGVNCTGSVSEMLTCARSINPQVLYQAAMQGTLDGFIFRPLVDGYFLPDEPKVLTATGQFKKCPIILGANKDEAIEFYPSKFTDFQGTAKPVITYNKLRQYITSMFTYYPKYPFRPSNTTLETIIHQYTNWKNLENTNANFDNLDYSYGDYLFRCPVAEVADTYASFNQDTYFYHFVHHSSNSKDPVWFGATHGAELEYVFGAPLAYGSTFNNQEKVLSRKILNFWSNFAKYSNPNGPNSWYDNCGFNPLCYVTQAIDLYVYPGVSAWPKYQFLNRTQDDLQRAYLTLNAAQITIDFNFNANACGFWNKYLPMAVSN